MFGITKALLQGALGGGGGFNPASLFVGGKAGLFYNTADLSSLFSDRSLTPSTPASVDGVVGTRKDLSGNGKHQVAPSDDARPTLRTDGAGHYWLEYDNINDNLVAASVALADSFALFQGVSALASTSSLLSSDSSNSPSVGALVSGDGSAPSSVAVTAYNVDSSPATATRAALFTAISSVNGVTPHLFEARTASLSTMTSFRTGFYPFGFAGFRRDYGALLISESDLGVSESDVRTWFFQKMGLP